MTAYTWLEIRSYHLKPGTHTAFLRLMADEAVPLLERWGIDVVGYGASRHDPDACSLMRAYPGPAAYPATQDAFYASREWRAGPRESVLALIDHYTLVVREVDAPTLAALRAWGAAMHAERSVP